MGLVSKFEVIQASFRVQVALLFVLVAVIFFCVHQSNFEIILSLN